jgi:hypothetical protein
MSDADDYPEWTDAQWADARRGAPWLWAGDRARTLLREAITDLDAAHAAHAPTEAAMAKLRAALAALEADPAHAAE